MPVAYHIIVHIINLILNFVSNINVTCRVVVSDKVLGVPMNKVQRGELGYKAGYGVRNWALFCLHSEA